jgi:hypothetical protein
MTDSQNDDGLAEGARGADFEDDRFASQVFARIEPVLSGPQPLSSESVRGLAELQAWMAQPAEEVGAEPTEPPVNIVDRSADRSQSLEKCPRCENGRIGPRQFMCTLCSGSAVVQRWVADLEYAQWMEKFASEANAEGTVEHAGTGTVEDPSTDGNERLPANSIGPAPSPELEPCPRCVQGRIGKARLTCTLCFGAATVQSWVADNERAQQASWASYLAMRRAEHVAEQDEADELGDVGRKRKT